jgi:hypothetical protein
MKPPAPSFSDKQKLSHRFRCVPWRQTSQMLMLMLTLIVLVCSACSPVSKSDPPNARPANSEYTTQADAPTPDYRVLLSQPALAEGGRTLRAATARLPPDAKAIGDVWLERLKGRDALLGSGLAGKTPDGPVIMIDTGFTEPEFDHWTKMNGWPVPDHISWSFVAPLSLPSVSDAAKHAIRIWPASTARTTIQNSALLRGRLELRQGCIFVGEFGQPAEKLAWFHAEIGLDVDPSGYLILHNRISGQTLTRVGEEIVWGGPASALIDSEAEAALHDACGPADIHIVGSPESHARFQARLPRQ